MDLGLKNRVALVAGSSRGIGLAIAAALLREGARVMVSGRNAESLREAEIRLARESGADSLKSFCGDLTESADIEKCVQQVEKDWGPVRLLVANVGGGSGARGLQADDADWESQLRTNLLGSVRVVRACVPGMAKAGGGSIVLIGSIAGLEAGPAPLGYSAAKAAVTAFGTALARELAPQLIRVNVVAPGNILFPGGGWAQKQAADPESVARYISAEVPMRRFGTPEEVAGVVTFLASDAATFVAGAVVTVDGAQTRALAS